MASELFKCLVVLTLAVRLFDKIVNSYGWFPTAEGRAGLVMRLNPGGRQPSLGRASRAKLST